VASPFCVWVCRWTSLLGAALLLLLPCAGCDWTVGTPNSPDRPVDTLQTRILQVRVQPSSIPPGSTATFTVAIADSSNPSFEYRWYLAGVRPVILSDTNAVTWEAPKQTGTATHVVVADNGSDSLSAPTREFTVMIEDPGQ
jgi:hypothetical protein